MDVLTVDLGNSRCKLCAWSLEPGDSPRLRDRAEFDSVADLGDRVGTWLAGRRFETALLCSVGTRAIEDQLARVLEPLAAPDPGLTIACRSPETVGRDRLFAARAALEVARGSAIVVDAGTALTVDAAGASEGRESIGTFFGGAIAPGPRLLAGSLANHTARLPLVDPEPTTRALGRDTREALLAGIATGFRGAARELVLRVSEEAGLADAPVVLTGGARAFLHDPSAPPVFGARRVLVEPELVHLGLLAALRRSAM